MSKGFVTSEQIKILEARISEFKDEIYRLERQVRNIRGECPHDNIRQGIVESFFARNHTKTTTDSCEDCGKVLKLVKETIKK